MTLKSQSVYRSIYLSRQRATTDLFAFIEGFYNCVRSHSALGFRSPEQFERLNALP